MNSTMNSKEIDSRDLEHRDSSDSLERGDEIERKGLISGIIGASKRHRGNVVSKVVSMLLVLSVAGNVFQLFLHRPHIHKPCISHFAHIPEREVTQTLYYNTEYTNDQTSEEEKEALWQNIDYSEGFISLSHEESDAMGIARSATFPWDASRGIYVVHGYHQMHCVVLLHAYTRNAHLGLKPIVSYHHIEHCLDMLRQDFLCIADDTPDGTPDFSPTRRTGDHQPRQCRDWSKLSDWARNHTSCYKTVNITYGGQDFGVSHQLDRYTHCPEDSPYAPYVQAYKDMSRPNKGNLDKEAWGTRTQEEIDEIMEFVDAHNSRVTAAESDTNNWSNGGHGVDAHDGHGGGH